MTRIAHILRLLSCLVAACLLGASVAAQTTDYSSLLNALDSDSDSAEADSDFNLGSLVNEQLLKQLLRPSASPAPASGAQSLSSALKAGPSPLATPVYHHACPLCGASFPGTAPYKGVAWGYRLDLRMYGQIKDPPDAPLCPQCRFPLYKSSYTELELSRLRPYVNSPEYKAIDARHLPYFYLAHLREKGIVAAKNGDYDIAHAYLQAAWQAEDLGEKKLETSYLETALRYVERFSKAAKRQDPYYPSAKVLGVELKRRLSRFTDAQMELARFEKDPEFSAPFLQRILAAEKALIQVEDPSPSNSP